MTDMPSPDGFVLPDRLRLPMDFDAGRLACDLRRLEKFVWTHHLVPQNYCGEWSVIPLRMPAGAAHPVKMIYADPTATSFEDAPALAHAPHMREALGRFACPLQSVRLMRLTPGSLIREHRDHDLAAEWGAARIHVPIATNDRVEFLLNGTAVPMAPGEAWYLRLSDPHSVANRGANDRVHLVIDCIVDEWLLNQLNAAAQSRQPSSVSAGSIG